MSARCAMPSCAAPPTTERQLRMAAVSGGAHEDEMGLAAPREGSGLVGVLPSVRPPRPSVHPVFWLRVSLPPKAREDKARAEGPM